MTPWLICGFTVLAVTLLEKWENRYLQSLFDWIPAILLAYLIPATISALLGRDFSGHEIHGYSRNLFIPLAIVAVMSSLSVRQLRAVGWKPVLVFLAGSCWIALFPVVLVGLLWDTALVTEVLVGAEYWKGIPPIVGSWIGGSTSQLVLKELVDCPEAIFLTVLVYDNILVNIWTILMFQGIKRSDWLNRRLGITDTAPPVPLPPTADRVLSPLLCAAALLASVGVTHWLLDSFIAQVLLLSGIGLAWSNLVRGWNFRFVLRLGGLLILTVMAILGLKLNFDLVHFDGGFLLFLIGWLVSHFGIMLVVARLLNVNAAWVHIASMANVGGIATAPAVTAAYEKKWLPHAVVLAILSMATGTFWGLVTIYLLQGLVG